MKIRELIEQLLETNDLDDEVFAMYWDKNYFVNEMGLENIEQNINDIAMKPITEDEFGKVWSKIVSNGENWLLDMGDRPEFYCGLLDVVCDTITDERESSE
jgi:hypothetical protein